MKNLSATFRQNQFFFLGYLLFSSALLLFCVLTGKTTGFLEINSFHTKFLDYLFIFLTHIGNGLFVIAVVVWMIIRRKYNWAWQTGISFLVTGFFVQILKHLVYSPRPKVYFAHRSFIHIIPGVTLTGSSSFPSGHAATVFALCTLLSFYFSDKRWSILFLMIACLTGFSRIYLSQHFPIDVFVGSLIGVSGSLIIYVALPYRLFVNPRQELPVQSIKLH